MPSTQQIVQGLDDLVTRLGDPDYDPGSGVSPARSAIQLNEVLIVQFSHHGGKIIHRTGARLRKLTSELQEFDGLLPHSLVSIKLRESLDEARDLMVGHMRTRIFQGCKARFGIRSAETIPEP